jgi:putative membrane-bound dehydrogenase-like protein
MRTRLPVVTVWGVLLAGTLGFGAEKELLASLETDPRVTVRLFAAEPQIIDPVALCFGADGACYAVEMRDYPLGIGLDQKIGGVVRRLRDSDGDGRVDESVVFAEGLSYPTSITPWRDGVIVAAPPDIIYLGDADHDGHAEVRTVVGTGFVRSFTDSNFNGLRLGFDGRIHGINGGNGGSITSPLTPGLPPVALGQLDFSFDPDSGAFVTTVETGGGFGLAFDAWGRSFTSHNVSYLLERVIPARYLSRVPLAGWLGPFTVFIAEKGHETRLFPIGKVQTRVNHPEQAGHFSSGSVPCLFDSEIFGSDFEGSVLTCDVSANLVHCDVLRREGAVAVASTPPETLGREFVASRDTAFRPTALEHGPDGAIYLADMQRDVIEHPAYIPAHVKKNLNQRAGDDRGRIYRITPKAGLPPPAGSLADARPVEWVRELASPLPWRRVTAHRLLVEKKPHQVFEPLEQRAGTEAEPKGRVRALWILHAWGKLSDQVLVAAMHANHAGVRANAAEIASLVAAPSPAVKAALVALAGDPEARVRLLAALALGQVEADGRTRALTGLLRATEDPWLIKAALIGVGPDAPTVLETALADESMKERAALIEPLAHLAASFHRPLPFLDQAKPFAALIRGLAAGATEAPPGERAAWAARLEAWASRLPTSEAAPLFDLAAALNIPAPETLEAVLRQAAAVAADRTAPEPQRVAAVATLGRGKSMAPLLALLSEATSAGVQQAAVEAIKRSRHPRLGAELLGRWRTINPAVRPTVIAFLVDQRPYHEALVSALERGDVLFSELNLDLEQRREFIREPDPALRDRSLKFFDDHEYSNRKKAVDDLLAALPERGDPKAGFKVFLERCQMCHGRGKIGNRVGPDLLGLNHLSTEDLLSNIVDPNMAIHPKYVACTVVTKAGDRHTGLLRDERPDSVSIMMPLGTLVTVPRAEIVSVSTLNRSLMPEGLDTGLLPIEIKGLIEFLQSAE